VNNIPSGVKGLVCLTIPPIFKAGDPAPTGYFDWHEWARVQGKAGLKQRKCRQCGLYRFPQEMGKNLCLVCEKEARP
jgi:hypothetical protein